MSLFITIDRISTALTNANIPHLIAGGCIRDTLLGAPVKDIDIFFDARVVLEQTTAEFIAKTFDAPSLLELEWTDAQLDLIDYDSTLSIWHEPMPPAHRPPFNLIFHEQTAEEVLAGFDFSICDCWWDPDGYGKGRGGTRTGSAFDETLRTKHVRYMLPPPNNSNQHERELRRLARLKEKFPDFTFGAIPQAAENF